MYKFSLKDILKHPLIGETIMSKRNLESYEISYLVLITFIIVQLFLIFVNIYNTQKFSIENFTVAIIELISILFSYFAGMVPAAIFSIVYIVGYIVYVIDGEGHTTLVSYVLMFFVPLSTIYAGNMNRTRKKVTNDLAKLDELEEMQFKMDPHTNLENEAAFKEVLSKQSNLAHRYSTYYFSIFMFRLEFIDTLRTLLDVKEFNSLLEKIARVVQNSIREEDYKFIVNSNRFVIITPLTSSETIAPAIRRILEGVGQLNIKDTNGDIINITLKVGGLDYSKDKHDMYKDYKSVLLALQKATEVDVYGEYSN
jgi:diguanylate cyclase (GGDEF)-like protein